TLYFEFSDQDRSPVEVSISNLSGKILWNNVLQASTSMDVNSFSPGIYIISAIGKGVNFHQKWLIK
ncbi:MAG: T9SS type A sorting domain-containing protein, partial [Bacteroidetes bacterium]|nr:T9SS type A sorting domain-containing protein [Bacteroidota bacterium]